MLINLFGGAGKGGEHKRYVGILEEGKDNLLRHQAVFPKIFVETFGINLSTRTHSYTNILWFRTTFSLVKIE